MPQPVNPPLNSIRQLVQATTWLLSIIVGALAIIAWGDDLNWHFTPVSAYVVFPVLGLTAYSLMWSSYIVGAARDLLKLDASWFADYFKVVGWVVLALICLHPGLLIYQRFQDGFGLPPGSYESYVAPGLGWVTLLGTASLLVFLAYESYRFFGEHAWWRYIQIAVDVAMVAIFYHGLRLGMNTGHGWFHVVWWFYGLTLLAVLAHKYLAKIRANLKSPA
jgi:hypothetical protein